MAAATPSAMVRMRSCSELRVSFERERMVPFIVQESGMTLGAEPAWKLPTVSTAGSRGGVSRLMTVWRVA